MADQVSCFLTDQRLNTIVEEDVALRMHMVSVVFRQRAHGKFQIFVDIQTARFVLFIEMIVAALVDFRVDQTTVNEELPPGMVAVAREKGMVEIENC